MTDPEGPNAFGNVLGVTLLVVSGALVIGLIYWGVR